uniref:30 kDa heat shock protein n=2 Tax=Endocarpon pusillum TaxID=364733 RepID=F8QX07_9EURO|nr:30 kDa heat shock protein [Endocarpon pusillum]
MQPYRATFRLSPQISRAFKASKPTRNMSLRGFPRFAPTTYHWGPSIARQNDFAPLFSLLDDLTNGEVSRRQSNSKQSQERFFAPRFDLKEVKDAYVLEGELPGVEQKDVSIEFTDEHTLVVSGRSEVHHEEGTRPKELGAPEKQAQIKDSSHKPTVEDESAESESTEVVKQTEDQSGKKEPEHTYWVSERVSGSFTRSFSFPARVNQDGVKAGLKNGILTVTVPKAAAPESRRINIE